MLLLFLLLLSLLTLTHITIVAIVAAVLVAAIVVAVVFARKIAISNTIKTKKNIGTKKRRDAEAEKMDLLLCSIYFAWQE